jgi:hypothetical protein
MTSAPKPTAQARQQGGFNQMLGQFNDEHMEENAMADAFQQKAVSQQSANPMTAATAAQAAQAQKMADSGNNKQTPREIGSLKDELIVRPVKDIVKEIKSFFDLNSLLGIKSGDTAEEQAKKQQVHSRWQKLDQEQQQIAQQKYQFEMKKKQKEEEEKQMKKQRQQQAEANAIAPPSSPKKGPVGPGGSGKQRAASQMEMDRKTLSNPKGAN